MSGTELLWTDPKSVALPIEDVHIWRAHLDLPAASLQRFAQTLSADEIQRMERFRFLIDRQRFAASRGILRTLLGNYLEIEPTQVQFCYGASGKPALDRSYHPNLEFNLSHSQDLMLCAVTQKYPVGIDLEHLRSLSDLEGLTERFFSPQEHRAIHTLPLEQRSRSFFQHWTCKEALLKAVGKGLINLSAVEVSVTPESVELVRWNDSESSHHWLLYSFVPAPEAVAAIAVSSQSPQLLFWQWQDND